MDNRTCKRLNKLITPEMEKKHFSHFEKYAGFAGNGVYTIDGLYSTDTRELLLMYCAKQEGIDYESESPKPQMLPDDQIDLKGLKENLQSCINEIWSDDYSEDNDNAEYAYEEAMVAFFGREIWDKINEKTSG